MVLESSLVVPNLIFLPTVKESRTYGRLGHGLILQLSHTQQLRKVENMNCNIHCTSFVSYNKLKI